MMREARRPSLGSFLRLRLVQLRPVPERSRAAFDGASISAFPPYVVTVPIFCGVLG